VIANVADSSGEDHSNYGGGIYIGDATAGTLVENCLVLGNVSPDTWGGGGGMIVDLSSDVEVRYCTIADNTATWGGGILWGRSTGRICNSIIWGNSAPNGPSIHLATAAPTDQVLVECSDVEFGVAGITNTGPGIVVWGAGNIDLDPLFVACPFGHLYHLSQIEAGQAETSPCVDAACEGCGVMPHGATRTDHVLDAVPPDMGYHYTTLRGLVDCQGIDGEDVLFVNGHDGTTTGHVVEVEWGNPIHFDMLLPSGGGNGKFVVHLNAGAPGDWSVTPLPGSLGDFCFPLLLSQGADPMAVWNSLGKPDLVGASHYNGTLIGSVPKAPCQFHMDLTGDPGVLMEGTVWTLQGIILNPAASSPKGGSVTNAIEIRVVP
jgi:hypothetical protein